MKCGYLSDYSLYIRGLFNMASSCSKWIGVSYASADCFGVKNYKEEFLKCYHVADYDLNLLKYDKSFDKLLVDIFGDDNYRLVDGLFHWIGMKAGNVKEIYEVDDSKFFTILGGESKGWSQFYFVEGLYFICCDKMVIALMIGNDE